jgi:uncharacterized protein YgbK (DUF1537 family)
MTHSHTLRSFCILADDLSGAADCAAAFARVCGPVPVVLGAGPAWSAGMAIDTDSRAMERADAVAATGRAFDRIARSDVAHELVYKKIDSTLRGHIGAELAAALGAAPQFAGAVVAPSFPEQGRTLSGGRLCLNGRPVDEPAQAVDLMSMLDAVGLQPALLAQSMADPAQVTQLIRRAFAGGARAVVVDAEDPEDLARLATALCAPAAVRLLVAGSAGLARALAQHLDPKAIHAGHERAVPSPAGPVLMLVGSFSKASAAQVQQVEASGDAQVIRLDPGEWQDGQHATARGKALDAAHETLRSGRNLLFAIGGAVTQPFSRSLVQAMARATAPLLQHAGTCVLTGGDTARALFNELAIDRLDVIGEFEPGISLARVGALAAPGFVLKAGGFGDALALQRIIRHFGQQRRHSTRRALAPS